MKKLIFLLLVLSAFAIPSRAQSVDASLSYSYFRLGGSGGLNQNGVSGSVAYNVHDWLGIVGDFGGYHASPGGASLNTYTYLFGPRVTLRNSSKFNPFGQLLLGGSRIAGGGGSSNQFAYSLGGGVDIGLLPHPWPSAPNSTTSAWTPPARAPIALASPPASSSTSSNCPNRVIPISGPPQLAALRSMRFFPAHVLFQDSGEILGSW